MGRANLINTMYDSTLSTIYTMYNRPHNTEMTDGYTFNPLLQAENTLLGILQQTQKRLIFSLFKYTLRYIDVQEGGTPAGRGDSNKSRPLRFLPPLRYSSSSKYGVRKQIWNQLWLYNINTFHQTLKYFQF